MVNLTFYGVYIFIHVLCIPNTFIECLYYIKISYGTFYDATIAKLVTVGTELIYLYK